MTVARTIYILTVKGFLQERTPYMACIDPGMADQLTEAVKAACIAGVRTAPAIPTFETFPVVLVESIDDIEHAFGTGRRAVALGDTKIGGDE